MAGEKMAAAVQLPCEQTAWRDHAPPVLAWAAKSQKKKRRHFRIADLHFLQGSAKGAVFEQEASAMAMATEVRNRNRKATRSG
jgi:hypothetical protein